MTTKELSQIFYINKEIEMWQTELDRIKNQSPVIPPQLTGMPGNNNISDKTGDTAITVADIEAIIKGKLAEIQIQRKRIVSYINSVDDSYIRQILFYRHISGMSWLQVALNMGGGNTGDGVRMAHKRFFDEN